MKRLISIELQKIRLNRASRVLTLTYFVLISLIAVLASIKFNIFGAEIRIADQGIFNFPYIWHFNSWVAVWIKLFFAVVVVSIVANEYSYGTLKQNLIDGLSKKELLLSKFLTVVLFSAISTIFLFIVTLVLGLCFSAYDEPGIVFSDTIYLLAYFVDLVAFFSFCIFAALLIKRSAFALGAIFLWFLFEVFLEYYLLAKLFGEKIAGQIVDFFPLESISNLIKEPVTRFQAYKAIENQVNQAGHAKDYSVHIFDIVLALVWTVIFVLMSYKLLKKRDL
jgi:ABC-type transport system involved in multi-copper enzyme maturation permease subunit